jgi:hypothetical protein
MRSASSTNGRPGGDAAAPWGPGDETPESVAATSYWAGLRDYHKKNDSSAPALERSRRVAGVLGTLGIASLLEVGTNSGRNLQVIRGAHPALKLSGIDVNEQAIAFAPNKRLDIDSALLMRTTGLNRRIPMNCSRDMDSTRCTGSPRSVSTTRRRAICGRSQAAGARRSCWRGASPGGSLPPA